LATCIKGACVAGGASATILGLGFGADKLLEEAGYAPFFKKTVGNQLGKILTNFGYSGNSEYLELQRRMLDIKQRVKNIEELNKIISEIENNDSFTGIKDELEEFKNEFNKELQDEKNIKRIQESKILSELKNIKKN
jgi:3-polyprenyl-4-hydroxybenzoate decarboxylase